MGLPALKDVLHHCTGLTDLNLSRNNLRRDGAETLAEALFACTALTSLDLRRNAIGDDGITQVGRASGMIKGLVQLDLSWNGLSDAGVSSVVCLLACCAARWVLTSRLALFQVRAVGEMLEENGALTHLRSVNQAPLRFSETVRVQRVSGRKYAHTRGSEPD